MNRPSNAVHMTGQELPSADDGAYPWDLMNVGDWFKARCPAAVLASVRNKKGGGKFAAVSKDGQNIVVRTQ